MTEKTLIEEKDYKICLRFIPSKNHSSGYKDFECIEYSKFDTSGNPVTDTNPRILYKKEGIYQDYCEGTEDRLNAVYSFYYDDETQKHIKLMPAGIRLNFFKNLLEFALDF